MKKETIWHVAFVALVIALGAVCTLNTSCSWLGIEKTVNEETQQTEWTIDTEKGQANVAEAKKVADGAAATISTVSPSVGTTVSVIANGVLAIVGGILGVIGVAQRKKNDGLLETIKESAIAAASVLDDEDLKKFIEEIKKIQTANGVREYVRATLKDGENIAARL